MDARQIYSALFDPRGPVREPRGEWRFVGDSACFDKSLLLKILSESIPSPVAYVAVSRNEAQFVPLQQICELARTYLSKGDVPIADSGLRHFVELSRVGVARAWCNDA
jgi:hypothetical protein